MSSGSLSTLPAKMPAERMLSLLERERSFGVPGNADTHAGVGRIRVRKTALPFFAGELSQTRIGAIKSITKSFGSSFVAAIIPVLKQKFHVCSILQLSAAGYGPTHAP